MINTRKLYFVELHVNHGYSSQTKKKIIVWITRELESVYWKLDASK